MKRDRNIMLRLSAAEHEKLLASKPDGEDLASFARRALLDSLTGDKQSEHRRLAAFVVAALSDSIEFEEALTLLDEHLQPSGTGVTDGRCD